MKRISCTLASATLLLAACAQVAPAPVAAEPKTEDEKILYAIGLALSGQVASFDLSDAELALVMRGLTDGAKGNDAVVDLQTYGPKINTFVQARMAQRGEREKEKGAKFLAEQAKLPGAKQTESGLVYLEETAGTGPSPTETSQVTIHYTGMYTDGKVFDSSRDNPDEPAKFNLRSVVPCFREGLMMMKSGGKAKIVCPSDIAYGDRGNRDIPPGATLVFDIELITFGDPSAASPG